MPAAWLELLLLAISRLLLLHSIDCNLAHELIKLQPKGGPDGRARI